MQAIKCVVVGDGAIGMYTVIFLPILTLKHIFQEKHAF